MHLVFGSNCWVCQGIERPCIIWLIAFILILILTLTPALTLTQAMTAYSVTNMIFSSSATVYGDPRYLPMDEAHPVGEETLYTYFDTRFFI